MASDHRGRDLHAGKRTAQELGWEEPFTLDHSGLFQAYRLTDPSPRHDSFLGTMAVWRNTGDERTTWRVDQRDVTPSTANIPDPGTDLGRGKTVDQGWDSVEIGTRRAVTGTTRTPARAIIAAEAMKKRIDEGRDLKTGRPKK